MEPVALTAQPVASPAHEAEPASSVGGGFKEYAPLYERFGIGEKGSAHVNRNLEAIWQWAKDHAETPDKDSILWQVTKLHNRIGDAPYGSAPYTKVLAYVSEYNRMLAAEKRLKEMEGAR